jgi:hypothetical protein
MTHRQRSGDGRLARNGDRRREHKLPRSEGKGRPGPTPPPVFSDPRSAAIAKELAKLTTATPVVWLGARARRLPTGRFSEPDWAAIAKELEKLPTAAPANARVKLEAFARRLWGGRSDRIERMPVSKLRRLFNKLSAAAEIASGWPDMETRIGALVEEVWYEMSWASRYRGHCDPDRNLFLSCVMQQYARWGGNLGSGNKRYVPVLATRFICAVAAAAGESVGSASIRAARNHTVVSPKRV